MKRKFLRRLIAGLLGLFILMNVIAAFHAYRFTHFAKSDETRTGKPADLSFFQKIKVLLTGVSLPRPAMHALPTVPFETLYIRGERKLECWQFHAKNNYKGIVVIFHGYGGEKSSMADKAIGFLHEGYDALLVDFRGAGGSEGNITTIGYKEANDVKAVVRYLHQSGKNNIVLFGTSMGATAIMKALADTNLPVRSAIIECPFGTMRQTVKNRFQLMDVPAFPMADLLLFWGGIENGFNTFSHNPDTYALKIKCPVLLMYGGKDEQVTLKETQSIFQHLHGPKKLVIFPEAGHENYLKQYKAAWTNSISAFLKQYN